MMESHIYRRLQKRNRSGSAATTGSRTEFASLPTFSSIFTAETHAIHLALDIISATSGKKFAVFTDARSCLQALQKQSTKTQAQYSEPTEIGKTVELCWIPVHAGIPGNEVTDKKKLKKHQDGKKKL